MPLLPLYTRGAGLHDGVLVGLQGRSPSWITTVSLDDREDRILSLHLLEASCSRAQQVVLLRTVWIWSARPTLSGRVRFGPPHGYPGVTSPTVAPERFTVEPQHTFVEGLGRVVAERLSFVLLFVRELFM